MNVKKLLPGPLGFGAAPLGNMFRAIPDEEATATVEAAWQNGIRYFDTAPHYGAGLAEIRLGKVLSQYPRDQYVISTKVGRIVLEEPGPLAKEGGLFEHGRPNKVLVDYTADGTLRSIEGSLKRLNTDHLEIIWVHDIAQDHYGDEWLGVFDTARKGAFRALTKLREEGVIKAWGLGVNRVEACELTLELDEPKPNGFLLAGRYTLLDHERALQRLMGKTGEAVEHDAGIVVGGPYSSGVLVGGKHFEYAEASPAILAKVQKIKQLADRFGVDIKAAALQFSLANPATAAVIPGASRPSRIAEDAAAVKAKVPAEFWQALRQEGLVSPHAPLPVS
jgi:D-threo-aldose 1-dehydrogenase